MAWFDLPLRLSLQELQLVKTFVLEAVFARVAKRRAVFNPRAGLNVGALTTRTPLGHTLYYNCIGTAYGGTATMSLIFRSPAFGAYGCGDSTARGVSGSSNIRGFVLGCWARGFPGCR